jgi:V/A-type H+-transporting ATPase subunit D
MQIKVAPTRMELLRLKKRIELAHRGHRLLQDKLEGLIKEFLPLIDEYVAAREELDRRYPRALAFTARAAAEVGEDRLGPALAQTGLRVEVEVSEQRRSGVAVPVMEAAIDRSRPFYSLLATPELFDRAVAELVDVLPLILKAVQLEQTVRRFAKEIERTRRRVNALEYILIPQLHGARKFIQAKLDEDERAARIRNMKVKEMLDKAAAQTAAQPSA